MDPDRQNIAQNMTGDWSWGKAREHFYNALTEQYENVRNENFANCFRALGQVLHLLQDMSVPMHTRNDLHIFPIDNLPNWIPDWGILKTLRRWTYETYTLKYLEDEGEHKLDFIPDQPGDRPDPVLLSDPQPQTDPTDYSHLPAVCGLFDRNEYNEGATSPLHDNTIGLAEYSNANFLTLDTMWDYPHPNIDNDTNYMSIDWLHPEEITAENGKRYKRLYIKFKDGIGEDIEHLAAVDYYTKDYLSSIHLVVRGGFTLDHVCYKDYAAKLIPRAVGYSAALLDYFFRGKMGVNSLPIFLDEGTDTNLHFLRLKVENMASGVTISDGTFALVCRYNDGGEEKTVRAIDYNYEGTLTYGDETEIDFELPFWPGADKISLEEYQSGVTCTLIFKGTLGNETDAVVGKVFTLGQEVKFEEAWDNGLAGNHPWTHSTAAQNPPNGETVNEVQDGILFKENKRYVSYSTPRNNESFLYIPGSGVTITPNTYVEFKIDELSVQERPPDGEHWQVLMLYFNNADVNIQFSCDEQFGGLGWTNVAYCSFTPGSITIGNIHQIFNDFVIEIPDPLYLTRIGFGQHLYELYEPSTAEHRQRTRVDFIRIIDAKEEQQE